MKTPLASHKAMLRADKLQVQTRSGGMYTVPNLTDEQLQLPTTKVQGTLLLLDYAPGDDGQPAVYKWTGATRPMPSVQVQGPAVVPLRPELHIAVSAPQSLASPLVQMAIPATALEDVFQELCTKLVGEDGDDSSQYSQSSLPQVASTSNFPYRVPHENRWQLSLGPPAESDAAEEDVAAGGVKKRLQQVTCTVRGCQQTLSLGDMRVHVAAHWLCGDYVDNIEPPTAEICGCCGRQRTVRTELVHT
jgi:hypothetical protein